MNIDEAQMRQILGAALSQGGDFADLYFEYTLRSSIILEEGIIKNSSKAVIMGVGIRVPLLFQQAVDTARINRIHRLLK